MKKVLYIGAGTPWAGGAGFLMRQQLFLAALGELADLHLAMFNADPQAWPPFACQFTPLPPPAQRSRSKPRQLLEDMLSSEPRMIRRYNTEPSRRAVAGLHPENFDAVFAYRIDFAHFSGVLKHPRLIVDIDDPEHLRSARRIAATTGSSGDWRTRRDIQKLKRFEHVSMQDVKLAIVCHESDRAGWPVEPAVVPNCVDVLANPIRKIKYPTLLFVGNCAGGNDNPNIDAVIFFVRDIWPRIRTEMPEAQFRIVGDAGDVIRKAVENAPGVTFRGFVKNVDEEYAGASTSIAPIRFGTGTRVKILDAFGHACPVISTPEGAEGIDAVDGQDIILATDAAAFAGKCVELMNNSELAERIGRGGHALASRHYDRRVQHDRIVGMLKTVLNGTGA